MPGSAVRIAAAAGAIALFTAFAAGDATATTICVPGFGPACPNSGGNKASADVEEAMGIDSGDGEADTVRVAPGTYVENGGFEPAGGSPETLEPGGSDPLTVEGSGRSATILTSGATANVYIVNLAYSNTRSITMRDLTIRIPASCPDGLAAAIQLAGDRLESVDLVSLNEGSDGIASEVGLGNVYRHGEVRGEGEGSIDFGLDAGGAAGGALLAEDVTVRGASWALVASEDGSQLAARRVDVIGSRTYGAIATRGSLDVENSVMTIDGGKGLYAYATASPTSLTANHITMLNQGGTFPAIEVEKISGSADVSVTVSNSIMRGFGTGYVLKAAAGPGIGTATLTARYSNFPAVGEKVGGSVDVGTGNIDADPMLTADHSPLPGSPSIDAGDPEPGGLTTDFLGAPRPVDGNGDGVPIRDQGAFEYQTPALPSAPKDTAPPQTAIKKGPGKKLAKGIAKFSFSSSEPGSTFECKLDRGKPKRCRSPRRYKHLRHGRHVFKVWATDAAGNRDPTPAKRRFRVPR